MKSSPWSEEFESILRTHCRLSDPEAPIDPDTPLGLLGADSMRVLRMMMDIEELLGVEIPDEVLAGDSFSTPRSAWSAVSGLRTATGGR